ncbi:MAG: hypothetical protein HY039_13425 [Nitrospirae bacterium]|nr:hypothetical protein [Nitrospirota bacterium]
MRNLSLLAGLWAAGVLLRAGFLVMPHIDSDQAIFGLQAIHVLRGEYPAFSWGTAYIGTAPTFLTAVLFHLFGASRLMLDVVPAIETAFWLPLVYLLGLRLGGKSVGLVAMALSALAPGYLAIHGAWARHGYMETVWLGTVLYLASERWWGKRANSFSGPRHVFVLGFLAGLAWWTNFLSVYFLAPLGLAVVAGLRGAAGGTIRFAAAGAVLGSLPFWIVNFPSGFPSLAMFGAGRPGGSLTNLGDLWARGLPGLLALPVDGPGVLKVAAWLSYAAFLGVLVRGLLRGRGPEAAGGPVFLKAALVLSLAVFPIVYAFSSFGNAISDFGTLRYLLPVYVLVYPLAALGAAGGASRPGVAVLALLPAVVFAVASDVTEYSWIWGGVQYRKYESERAREARLFDGLQARGLDRVRVLDYWLGPRLTFDSGERIVFAEAGTSRYPGYARAVANAPRAAYLLSADDGFEAQVRAMGGEVERERVEGYEIYHGFAAPRDSIRSLSSDTWRIVGSESRGPFDRRPETTWTAPSGGEGRLEVDLGRPEAGVCGVAFFPGTSFPSRPRDLRIYTSSDGRRWVRSLDLPAVFGGLRVRDDGVPILDAGGFLLHRFPARTVRRIRIESSGSASGKDWAVAEMFVLARGESNPARRGPTADLLAEGEESLSREKWSEAWRLFSLVRVADPHSPEAQYGLARSLASARVPDEPGRERAAVLSRAGFADEAAREYERLVSSRDVRGSDYLNLADTNRRLERHDAAERILRDKEAALAPPGPVAVFGSCFRLEGLRIDPSPAVRGGSVEVSYQWGSRCSIRQDLGVFVHLEGAGGRRFQDDHLPLDGAYPTDRWPAGEVVRERRKVDVPSDLPPGEYRVFVGVVNRRLWNRRLPVTEPAPAAGNRFLAATVDIR